MDAMELSTARTPDNRNRFQHIPVCLQGHGCSGIPSRCCGRLRRRFFLRSSGWTRYHGIRTSPLSPSGRRPTDGSLGGPAGQDPGTCTGSHAGAVFARLGGDGARLHASAWRPGFARPLAVIAGAYVPLKRVVPNILRDGGVDCREPTALPFSACPRLE